jgi:cysteinyl-tRNA synthetase
VSIYLCWRHRAGAAAHRAHPVRRHFDILRRWLTASGYEVTFCRNVTDIDDKIIRTAQQQASRGGRWPRQNQRAFTRAYNVLGCLRRTSSRGPPATCPR